MLGMLKNQGERNSCEYVSYDENTLFGFVVRAPMCHKTTVSARTPFAVCKKDVKAWHPDPSATP